METAAGEDLTVVVYANHHQVMVDNLRRTLEKYGYKHAFVGEGEKWKGLITKVKGWLGYIKNLPDESLVLVVDAYDVMACAPPRKLIKRYRKLGGGLVIGAETQCNYHCSPVPNYWEREKKKTRLRYVNSGFYMGKASVMKKVMTYLTSLEMEDDQMALCRYVDENPDKVTLDYGQRLVANITIVDFPGVKIRNGRIFSTLTSSHPCFVHLPGKESDFLIRCNFMGDHILGGDYLRTPYRNIVGEYIRKSPVFFNKWVTSPFALLVLVVLVLVLIPFFPIVAGVFFALLVWYSRGLKYI